MPPKKGKKGAKGKKGKKGKKKGDAKKGGDEEALSLEEKLNKASLRVEALERLLVLRTEQMHRAHREQQEFRDRIQKYHADFKREQEERFMVAADMTRQYKAMQEELINRINALETDIGDKKDKLEISRLALEETRKEKDNVIADKDKQIAEQKQKIEEMAVEFGNMLKETLEKMSKRIDNGNMSDVANELQASNKRRLDEFRLANVDI